jgi:hypothetical protein
MAKYSDLKKLKNRVKARKLHYDQSWQARHRSLSEHFMPERGRFDGDDLKPNEVRDNRTLLADYTGSVAARRYAASLYSGLAPPTRAWKLLTTMNKDIKELSSVKADLEARNKIMDSVLQGSNFYNVIAESFEEDVCFALSAVFVDRDFEDVVRYHTFTAGTYYIAEDSKGRVNTFYRRYSDTVDNIVEKFGEENVSAQVLKDYNGDGGHRYVKIVHAIEPNRKRDTTKIDNLNMPFRSVYYEEDQPDNEKALRSSGYQKFPVVVSRLNKICSDVYGWSECWQALGLSKALNAMVDDMWAASESMAKPTVLVNDKLRGKNLKAGSAVYYNEALGDNTVRNAFQVDYDLSGNLASSDRLRELIRNVLNQDLFSSILSIDRNNMTATEISARVAQAAEMLVKVVSRMINEKLKPILELTYDIIDDADMFPEPPPEMIDEDLELVFVSSLALAQQQIGIVGIEQFVDFINRLAQINPTVLDKFDADQTADEYLERTGAPVKMLKSDEEVANDRAAQEVERQQDRTAEMLSMTADGTQKLANAPLNTDSALDATMGAIRNVQ